MDPADGRSQDSPLRWLTDGRRLAGAADRRRARDGAARGSAVDRRPARGRARPSPRTDAAMPSPTWSGRRPGRRRPGPPSGPWPGTTSRPTPASGSATTAGSTPSAGRGWKGSGYVRWDHGSNRGFLRCLDGLRTSAGGHRRGRRRGAVRPVPRPARSLLASRPDRVRGLVGGARGRAPGARLAHLRSALVAAAVVAGRPLLGGCAGQEQSGPPAARVATWVSGGGGGPPSGRCGWTPPTWTRPWPVTTRRQPSRRSAPCSPPTPGRPSATCPLPTRSSPTISTRRTRTPPRPATTATPAPAGTPPCSPARPASAPRLASQLAAAVARITLVTGHPPSTSTTRPADTGDPFAG